MNRSSNDRYRVAVIDDEPDVSIYISTILESNDYETMVMSNLDHGIDKIGRFKPDLVCLDIMMPQETGVSFYRRMRRDKKLREIPVIIISGASPEGEFGFDEYVNDGEIAPPDFYMEKPIVISEFLSAVKRLIRRGAK